MAGISDLLEAIVGCTVDFAGNGAIHGGKGILVAGARKIGWAKGGSAGRQGRRFAGHSLAGKSLASGVGGARGNLHHYNPKNAYEQTKMGPYHQSMKCGSGIVKFGAPQRNAPNKLHGRPYFDAPGSPLGREGGKWIKSQSQRPSSYSKNPRGFINTK